MPLARGQHLVRARPALCQEVEQAAAERDVPHLRGQAGAVERRRLGRAGLAAARTARWRDLGRLRSAGGRLRGATQHSGTESRRRSMTSCLDRQLVTDMEGSNMEGNGMAGLVWMLQPLRCLVLLPKLAQTVKPHCFQQLAT
eukprot:5684876-Prymnesium_polylepis.2